ncbi:MAG: hypothetical protein HBSAPP03_10080 [Phycisphaerae bacterium]|nr:MAG: hypothetical protein HBSAPP03_10080 [Phycisphaerae bacterium]
MNRIVTLLGMAALAAAVGCAQQQRSEPAKTEPAKAEATRPAFGSNTVFFPAGTSHGAALAVERMYPAEVSSGGTFDYSLKVTNVSGTDLQSVVLTESIPAGFTASATSPQGTPTADNKAWNFALGNFASGEAKTVKITGSAKDVAAVTSCATLTYVVPVCQTIPVVKPALTLTKSAPAEVMVCDVIPMRLVVTNNGTGAARNVKVTDTLPAGLTVDGQTTVSFDAGTLNAGQSREFAFNAKAAKRGSYENTGKANADGGLSATSNKTTTVVRQPELDLKVECPEGILLGRIASFKFTVSNKGDGVSANTVLTAPIPAGSSFVSADNGGVVNGNNVVWNLGSLGATGTRTVTMSVRSMGAGSLAASGSVSGTCANTATHACNTGVRGTPDMATLLDDGEGVVLVGANHSYRYEVTNQGQVDLTNVKTSIVLPEGMEFVSSTFPGQPVREGRKLTWTAATALKAGEKRAYTIVVRVTKDGEYLAVSETTCSELRSSVRDDEVTVFVPQ